MKKSLQKGMLIFLVLPLLWQCRTVPVEDPALEEQIRATLDVAWEQILDNQFEKAEKSLEDLRSQSPSHPALLRALGVVKIARADETKAVELFFRALQEDPSDPVNYAILNFIESELPYSSTYKPRLISFYRKLLRKPRENWLLKARGEDTLLDWALNVERDLKATRKLGTNYLVQDWSFFGPLSNVSGSGIDPVHFDETNWDMTQLKKVPGLNNMSLDWSNVTRFPLNGIINMSDYLGNYTDSAGYATRKISIKKQGTYILRFSCNGAARLWLDKEEIYRNDQYTLTAGDEWLLRDLTPGSHTILIKLATEERDMIFRLAVTPLEDYPGFTPSPGFTDPVTAALSTAGEGSPENSFWLVYYLTSKGHFEEARRELEGLKKQRSGKMSAFLSYLEGLIARGEGNEVDAGQIFRKLYDENLVFPPAYRYMIENYIRDEREEKALESMEKVTALNPTWSYRYEFELQLALQKEDLGKIRSVLQTLSERSPRAALAVNMAFLIAGEDKVPVSLAESTRETMGLSQFRQQADRFLLDLYFFQGYYSRAFTLAADLITYYPADNHLLYIYFYSGQQINFDLMALHSWGESVIHDYPYDYGLNTLWYDINDNFYNSLKTFMEINSKKLAWNQHEAISSAMSNYKDKLIEAAAVLLNISPWDYELRQKYNTLYKLKSFETLTPPVDLDQIIADFEKEKQTWESDAVIVLDRQVEMFFGKGASRSSVYRVVRVLSENGVKQESTYVLEFNPYFDDIDIKKAGVRKPDGSFVEARLAGNRLSFQGLQPGDYLVINYSVNQFMPGELNENFWSSFALTSYYPAYQKEFTLLYPVELNMSKVTHNLSDLSIEESEENFGSHFKTISMKAKNLEGVQFASLLPDYKDVYTWVDFSSLPDWSPVSRWFFHLYKGRTKPTWKIRRLAEELTAGLTTREEKIKAIYTWVARKIQYEDLTFMYSAYVPQEAESVYEDGYGDCKDKAALLISLLKASGIEAHMALNTPGYRGGNYYLPSPRFNHVVVVIPGDKEWILDPTSEFYTFPDLPAGSPGSYYLPVFSEEVKDISRIPEPESKGKTLFTTSIAKQGKDYLMKGSMESREFYAGLMRSVLYTNDEKLRHSIFSGIFSYSAPGLYLEEIKQTNLDNLGDAPVIDYEGVIVDPFIVYPGGWLAVEMPWMVSLSSALEVSTGDIARRYPLAIRESQLAAPVSHTIEVDFPAGYRTAELPENASFSFKEAVVTFRYSVKNGKILASREYYIPFMDVTPDEFDAYKAFILKVSRKEKEGIMIKK